MAIKLTPILTDQVLLNSAGGGLDRAPTVAQFIARAKITGNPHPQEANVAGFEGMANPEESFEEMIGRLQSLRLGPSGLTTTQPWPPGMTVPMFDKFMPKQPWVPTGLVPEVPMLPGFPVPFVQTEPEPKKPQEPTKPTKVIADPKVLLRLYKPRHWREKDKFEEIPQAQKMDPGGFTVANKNDSDSSGTEDRLANRVVGEKDLMRLDIELTNMGPGDQLEFFGNDKAQKLVQLWPTEDKAAKDKPNDPPIKLGTSDKPITKIVSELTKGNIITLFIEGTDESSEVHDVEITVRGRVEGKTAEDSVRLTFIWAKIDTSSVDILHTSQIERVPVRIWEDAPPHLSSNDWFKWAGIGSTFGVRPGGRFTVTQEGPTKGDWLAAANVIGIRFAVAPKGIGKFILDRVGKGNDTGIRFDLTRDMDEATFVTENLLTGPITGRDLVRMNSDDEFPNDDRDPADPEKITDESRSINENDHLMVIDMPRFTELVGTKTQGVFRFHNMREWVRVRFDGSRPIGHKRPGERIDPKQIGSRCSKKEEWHSVMAIRIAERGTLERINNRLGNTGLAQYLDRTTFYGNDIGPGEIRVPKTLAITQDKDGTLITPKDHVEPVKTKPER